MNSSQLVELNKNRSSTYLFLSKSFEKELTKEQIEELRKSSGPVVDPRSIASSKNDDIQEGFELISSSISEMKKKRIEDATIWLAADYAGVFLGVKHDILPHPSESAYSNMEHLIYQPQRSQVAFIYEQAGLEMDKKFTEPEDHVAVELGFMALLGKQTASCIELGKNDEGKHYAELQASFLEGHLLRWTPKLCEDILKAAETDFYRGIARVTRGFLSEDAKTLSEMLADMKSGK